MKSTNQISRLVSAHGSGIPERDEARRRTALAQTWVLLHLGGALAQRSSLRNKKGKYAFDAFKKLSEDAKHYVLSACSTCRSHYDEYLKTNAFTQNTDFERWVFDLHNSVNERLNKDVEGDFEQVRDYYRKELESLGRDITITKLSNALPAIAGRYCYSC